MAATAVDMTGNRYGRLVAMERVGAAKSREVMWRFMCDCGNASIARGTYVRSGRTISCGCYRTEKTYAGNAAKLFKHGEGGDSITPEYRAWKSIFTRCFNKNFQGYRYYGGKGVSVCDRWNDYRMFLADMGRKPSPRHSIDRIDGNGNYEPKNCRWATKTEQSRNKSNNKLTMKLVEEIRVTTGIHREIARRYGVNRSTVSAIKRGDIWKPTG